VQPKKIAVVVTARSSYARIKTALEAMEAHPALDVTTIVMQSATMPRYGGISEYEYLPTAAVNVPIYPDPSLGPAWHVSEQIVFLAEKLQDNFDAVVTIGDRPETLGTAIAAAYGNIPLCHIQGGEITGNLDNKVRHAITQLADLHLVATQAAADNVYHMLRKVPWVFVTGCPSIDLCAEITPAKGVGIMGLYHPDTAVDGSVNEMALTFVREFKGMAAWYGPNIDPGNDAISKEVGLHSEPAEEFLAKLAGATCLVGNSSSGIREASYFGTPVVNIGQRQHGRERGPNVIDVGYDLEDIRKAITLQVTHGPYESSDLYGDGHAGEEIAERIAEWA